MHKYHIKKKKQQLLKLIAVSFLLFKIYFTGSCTVNCEPLLREDFTLILPL